MNFEGPAGMFRILLPPTAFRDWPSHGAILDGAFARVSYAASRIAVRAGRPGALAGVVAFGALLIIP